MTTDKELQTIEERMSAIILELREALEEIKQDEVVMLGDIGAVSHSSVGSIVIDAENEAWFKPIWDRSRWYNPRNGDSLASRDMVLPLKRLAGWHEDEVPSVSL
jgi:hypothetical protein